MNELTPQEGQPLSAPRQRPRAGQHVRPRAPQAKEEAQRLTPDFLFSVFRQWWKVVVPAGLLLASVAVGIILYTHVNEYDAAALIVIHEEVTGKSPFSSESLTGPAPTFIPGASLYQGLTQIEVDQAVLKARAQALRDAPLRAPDDSAASGLLDLTIDNHPNIREQEDLLVAIRSRMGEIKKRSVPGESHASCVDLANVLQEEQAKLADRKKGLREEMQAQRMQGRQQALEQIDAELAILDAKKSVLTSRVDKQVVERKTGGTKSVQFEFARAELAREEQVFELIAERKLALQTELRAPAQVRLRKKARVPTTPIEPIPYKKMLLAALVASACPFGLAVVRELTVRRTSS